MIDAAKCDKNNGRPLDTMQPGESHIVWLCDVSGIPYVRESEIETRRRYGKPGCRFVDGVIVGYIEIAPEIKADRLDSGAPGFYLRRVFWLATHDRTNEPEGVYVTGAPCEAVALSASVEKG